MQRIANPWTSVRLRDAPPFATLAQLVERNLAKVEVTSSNLVCRSKLFLITIPSRVDITDGVSITNLDLCALVVELVDTRDLKSLGVRAVPVQVRPGAPSNLTHYATLAQLVERNLAKVEVTSSNLVCRSKFKTLAEMLGFFALYVLLILALLQLSSPD